MYTNKEWTVSGKSGNPGESYVIETEDGGKVIAYVANTFDAGSGEELTTQEDTANAHMIAAAPRLYSGCMAGINMIDEFMEGLEDSGLRERAAAALEVISNALQAASGKGAANA